MNVKVSPIDHVALLEAISYVLAKANGRMRFTDLLSIIGLADHLMIKKVGSPISGDDFFALPNGPIPIHLFIEITDQSIIGEKWLGKIHLNGAYLEMTPFDGFNSLSRGHQKILDQAIEMIQGKPIDDVVESLSRACPEWLDSINKIIPLAEVYVAFGASRSDALQQVSEIRSTFLIIAGIA